MSKILVVDDDEDLRNLITRKLSQQNYVVDAAQDGDEALAFIRTYPYELVVLDVNMPGLDGFEVLRTIRRGGDATKVLMLTTRAEIEDKLTGFKEGADDYLGKPFDTRELLARIEAILSRPSAVLRQLIVWEDLELDASCAELRRNGVVIKLQPRDLALLVFFMRHPNEVFSVEALLDRVWSADSGATVDGLRTAVTRIRRAIDQDPENSIIQNVHRVGYRLRVPHS